MDSATTFPATNNTRSSASSSPLTTTIQATQVIPSSSNNETLDPKAGQSPEILCGICAESKERDQMLTVENCTHSFCSDCIIKHVAPKIQEGIHTVYCPGLDCKAVLELEACTPVLPKSLVERWNEALFEALTREEQWKMCPRCTSYVEKTRGCLRITCRCNFQFCYGCAAEWTDDHRVTCQGDEEEDAMRHGDRIVVRVMNRSTNYIKLVRRLFSKFVIS